ncbi:cytochrome c peroxidase [uncultured Photobacterium sp.]|uniref:cytochrome-c peroxidase n=1 Tax=uncultured Photobacterium sp. TaxID=173973 RepID=UPI00260BB43D|nr:cytochrome c peroxidase [uncultured Photobacterium sp.]
MNKTLIRNKISIRHYRTVIGLTFCMGLLPYDANAADNNLTYLEEMGKRLFFEEISLNRNMSCSSCHSAGTGGTNGDSETNLGEVAVRGSDRSRIGTLKPPTNKYAQFLDDEGKKAGLKTFDPACPAFGGTAPCGGAFWNGRAEGDLIENFHEVNVFEGLSSEYETMYRKYLGPVSDQAHASPYTNPVEQALPDKKSVCMQVSSTEWGEELYKYAWGTALSCDEENVDKEFARFAVSLTAWQMSSDNNRFDSKRDVALKGDEDGKFPLDIFTEQENRGHDLFYGVGPGTGARCFFCHQSENNEGVGKFERYTNDRYFNLGVPYNHEIPNAAEPNRGLFEVTSSSNHLGQHKVPTLRNVDKRPDHRFMKAYTHNGWFKTVEQLVHFYNSAAVPTSSEDIEACANATTDEEKLAVSTACFFGKTRCEEGEWTVEEAMETNCWPEPEIKENVAISTSNFGPVGNLKMTKDDEAAVVSYLKTLSDRTSVIPPRAYQSQPYDERRLKHNLKKLPH